ncbi:hypothetical protein [Salipaludibacillus daqingensis]|uniref:hypothetical protein n=1 Tax=Salipaludibacillus daqingensis TaxID=3041001 RepID=UPI00247682DA|nr:hypothetical protein [Salipaludibacillus daqingensis]
MESNRIIVTGHYGSGKTEYALHEALQKEGSQIYLCDLDVINPYFRSRDYKEELEVNGVNLVAPKGDLMKADLPIVTGEVAMRLNEKDATVIIDVGGDEDGATVLGQFAPVIEEMPYEFLFIANMNRPSVATAEKMISVIRAIELNSRLHVTGIIHNTHLCGEAVTSEEIHHGETVCQEVSKKLGVPLVATMIEEELYKEISESLIAKEQLIIFKRRLRSPWYV